MNLDDLIKPGSVTCMLVKHDDWCPGVHGDGNNCICNPDVEIVDEAAMVDSIVNTRNRAQRRAAARKSKKGHKP